MLMSESENYPLNLMYQTDPLFRQVVDELYDGDNAIEFVKNNPFKVFLPLYIKKTEECKNLSSQLEEGAD